MTEILLSALSNTAATGHMYYWASVNEEINFLFNLDLSSHVKLVATILDSVTDFSIKENEEIYGPTRCPRVLSL